MATVCFSLPVASFCFAVLLSRHPAMPVTVKNKIAIQPVVSSSILTNKSKTPGAGHCYGIAWKIGQPDTCILVAVTLNGVTIIPFAGTIWYLANHHCGRGWNFQNSIQHPGWPTPIFECKITVHSYHFLLWALLLRTMPLPFSTVITPVLSWSPDMDTSPKNCWFSACKIGATKCWICYAVIFKITCFITGTLGVYSSTVCAVSQIPLPFTDSQ